MTTKTLKAFVFSDGVIHLAETSPEGAIEIAQGPDSVISMAIVETAVGNGTGGCMVPGISPQSTLDQAYNAVLAYGKKLNSILAARLAEFGGRHETASSNQF